MQFASLPGQLQGAPPMVTTDVEPGLDGKMKNKVHTEPVTERPHGLWDRGAEQAQQAGRWRKFIQPYRAGKSVSRAPLDFSLEAATTPPPYLIWYLH